VRLEYDMNLAKSALPRRRQRRLDLRGMVPVIINHAHPSNPTTQLKPPVDSAKLIQSHADRVHRNIKPHPHCDGSRRIQNVMNPRHMQRELT